MVPRGTEPMLRQYLLLAFNESWRYRSVPVLPEPLQDLPDVHTTVNWTVEFARIIRLLFPDAMCPDLSFAESMYPEPLARR